MNVNNLNYKVIRKVLGDRNNLGYLERNRLDGIFANMKEDDEQYRSHIVEFITKVINVKYKMNPELDPLQMLPVSNTIPSFMYYQTDVTDITVPKNIRKVEGNAFKESALQKIVFTGALPTLETNTFADCTKLEIVELPEGLKTIESGAFKNCPNLQTVVIPATIEAIQPNAFLNVNNDYKVLFKKGVVAKWKSGDIQFYTKENMQNYYGVNKGGHGVFEDQQSAQANNQAQSQSANNQTQQSAQANNQAQVNSEV